MVQPAAPPCQAPPAAIQIPPTAVRGKNNVVLQRSSDGLLGHSLSHIEGRGGRRQGSAGTRPAPAPVRNKERSSRAVVSGKSELQPSKNACCGAAAESGPGPRPAVGQTGVWAPAWFAWQAACGRWRAGGRPSANAALARHRLRATLSAGSCRTAAIAAIASSSDSTRCSTQGGAEREHLHLCEGQAVCIKLFPPQPPRFFSTMLFWGRCNAENTVPAAAAAHRHYPAELTPQNRSGPCKERPPKMAPCAACLVKADPLHAVLSSAPHPHICSPPALNTAEAVPQMLQGM